MKIRKLKGGGIRLYQMITKYLVFSIVKGPVIDGGTGFYRFSIEWRKNTNLQYHMPRRAGKNTIANA